MELPGHVATLCLTFEEVGRLLLPFVIDKEMIPKEACELRDTGLQRDDRSLSLGWPATEQKAAFLTRAAFVLKMIIHNVGFFQERWHLRTIGPFEPSAKLHHYSCGHC